MNLLIDLGNSRLKWAASTYPDEIITGHPVLNSDITPELLCKLWQDTAKPDLVAIACVSNRRLYELTVTTVDKLWPGTAVYSAKSQASAYGLTNAYSQPEKLGVDRWLSMVAAYQHHETAFCLVGCGTAITIDIVDHNGKHQGGLITPGLRLMQHALAEGTENLDLITATHPTGLAVNTDAAIYNGTLYAVCGLIERTINQQLSSMPLILTGGDAELIAQTLTKPAVIRPNLVLYGLALTITERL
jgi:type III pantothenate kinase